MNISVLCITYARVGNLEEMLASYLNQQTDVQKELIILNTYPEQFLVFDHPEVKIINLKERPKSLGEARHQSVMWSNYSHIITVDDDDTILPHHIATYEKYFEDNDWIMPEGFIFTTSAETIYKRYSIPAAMGYTLKAYALSGGYRSMNSGEDQDFNDRVMASSNGKRINLDKKELSYVYNWDNGVYHMSGRPDDKEMTGHERMALHVEQLKKEDKIPTGRIILEPKVNSRYAKILNTPL